MDSEENSDDSIFYILDYVSDFLEPNLNIESKVGLSATESLAFIHSLAAEGMKIEEDGSASKIVDSAWNTRIVIRELYREIMAVHQNGEKLLQEGVESENIISYHESNYGLSIDGEERERIEELSIVDNFEEFSENLIAEKLSERILPFFAISQVLIEDYCVELINEELISDFYSDNGNTIEFLQELSQPTREQLIQRTELLDGHEVGRMIDIRKTRNETIHSLHGAEHWKSIMDSVDDVNRCIDVIITIESELGKDDMFQWR